MCSASAANSVFYKAMATGFYLEVRFWGGGGGGEQSAAILVPRPNYSCVLKYFLGIIVWPRDYSYTAIYRIYTE